MRSSPFLPADDRLVLIEDTAELQLDAPNLVRFEARREQAGVPAITIRDLLRATLRHRPDRILVGRGPGRRSVRSAASPQHRALRDAVDDSRELGASRRCVGSPRACCSRASTCRMPAIRHGIAECLQVLVHLERRHGRRVVTELVRVRQYDAGDRPVLTSRRWLTASGAAPVSGGRA